jgi:hypothetical protein
MQFLKEEYSVLFATMSIKKAARLRTARIFCCGSSLGVEAKKQGEKTI